MKKLFKKAFTLVELVVVIAIIAILTAVSVVSYVNVTEEARKATYSQLANQTLTQLSVNNGGAIENDTYIFVTSKNKSVAWYRYESGTLEVLENDPILNDINHACPLTNEDVDYIPKDVEVYRPIVTDVVDKINKRLSGSNVGDYSNIAEACKTLNAIDVAIINWGRKSINYESQHFKYSFAYDRENNVSYILSGDCDSVVYSNTNITSVPSHYRFLTGVNIENEQNLFKFSKITNEWDWSNNFARPNSKNFYLAHSQSEFEHAPLVFMNLNNDVDMSLIEGRDDWEAIANWYNFTGCTASVGNNYSNCYDISLLVNGNNKKIRNLSYDVLFGAVRNDSILKDFEIVYNMGTQDNFWDITMGAKKRAGLEDNLYIASRINGLTHPDGEIHDHYWNFGIMIRTVRSVQSSTFDRALHSQITNVTLSGNCYANIWGGDGEDDSNKIGIVAAVCSEKYNGGEGYSGTGPTKVDFNNMKVFANPTDNYYKDTLAQSKLHYNAEADGNCATIYVDGLVVDKNAGYLFH